MRIMQNLRSALLRSELISQLTIPSVRTSISRSLMWLGLLNPLAMKSKSRMFNTLRFGVLYPSLTAVGSAAFAGSFTVFSTDFNSGAPPEFSGVITTEGVQGYDGLGTGLNVFDGDFLRNTSGTPPLKSTLTLTGLPPHISISLGFLLAIIDSWDGIGCSAGTDTFRVRVDGSPVFCEVFANVGCGTQGYDVPPCGVELARSQFLGFNPGYQDSAYNMGLDPVFQNIPHTAGTLTVEWFAGNRDFTGGDDESWAIDNVEVILNDVVVPVAIDIKPGTFPNSINPRSKGVIPVAILTADTFNATANRPDYSPLWSKRQ
jgi:hypothetical protein